MTDASARPSTAYYVAVVALVLAVGTGIGLFYLLTVGEARPSARFSVTGAEAAPCPPGTGAPACYTFNVTNTGDLRGLASCTLGSAPHTAATFANDETSADVSLLPNETRQVYVKVIATSGDIIQSPDLTCS